MKTIPIRSSVLLKQALTHRSWLNEHSEEKTLSNERLEFLGDAVLELIVTKRLFEHFPEKPEGELTNLRASLVRTETLAEVAKSLDVGKKLRLSRGEETTGGRENVSLLADTLEAIVGAIYLDKGFGQAQSFVEKHLIPKLHKIMENNLQRDAKSLLQERVQAQNRPAPVYKVESEEGPDHNKIFMVAVFVAGKKIAKGTGKSKQQAQQQAAKAALEKYPAS